MKKYYATFLFLLASFLGGSYTARGNFISYSETVYNTDFLSAGLGGLRNVGTGAIVLTNLTGTVKKAYLFWHGPMVASATNPAANATIKLNGQTITGVNLGFSSDNCWSTIDTDANYVYSAAYRADVTGLVASKGNGSYTLSDTIKAYGYRRTGATNLTGININGASLLVFYDDGNPNNNRDIVLYEGNDSNAQSPFAPNTLGYDDSGWNVKLSGINYTSGPVTLQLHISDGQYFEPGDDGDVVLNKTIILEHEGHVFSGNTTPRLNDGPYHMGSLWDIKNYTITPYLTPGPNSISVSNSAIGFDCVSLIVAAVNLPSGAAPHTNAAPTLACQAPVTISAGSAVITSEVFYSAATPLNYTISVDNITVLTGTLPSSGTPRSALLSLTNVFSYGQHTVTFSVMDSFGNATCSSLVTVLPSITCSTNIVQSTDLGKSSAVVQFTVGTEPAGLPVVCVPPSDAVFPIGTTTVNCTATDTNRGSATCSFLVTIRDTEPPMIQCPPSTIVSTAPGTNNAIVSYVISATDNLPGVTSSCQPASGSVFPLGVTTVHCTARDAAGNNASCDFTVTVNDTEPPSIQCPTNIVKMLELGKTNAVVTWTIAASDNAPGVTVTCIPPSGSVFQKGSTAVNCTARDLAGNISSCGFTVIVTDGETPVIFCPGKDIVQATDPGTNNALVTFSVTATDNLPGVTVVCSPASGTLFPIGTNDVTCTATDVSGNKASCSFNVIIVDQEPPQISCPANVPRVADAGACTVSNVVYFANAQDNVPGVSVRCEPPSGSTFSAGSTPVTCTATDAAGNHSSCSFLVNVEDQEAPKLTLPGDLPRTTDPGSCSAVVNFDPGATDNCPGQLLVVCVPPSGSTFQKGTTVVTCRATDVSGNSVTNTFHVTVNDTEAPHVVCPADIVQPAETGRTDAIVNFTVNATDNCGQATVVSTPASGSRFSLGTNRVTSVATDSSGNTNSCTFLVIVVDQESPHIVCPAPIVRPADQNTCSATNVTYSLSVTDNVALGVSYACVPPSGSAFPVGTNRVNCTATDAAGNKASCAFTITIEDKQIPALTLPPDISQQTDAGSCSAVISFNPTAFDLCSNPVILVCVPPSGSTFQKGSTVVTCRATDASGNSVTNTFHVTVNDTEAPHVVCPGTIIQPAETGRIDAIVNFTVTATDNCGQAAVVSTPASGSRFSLGTNLVTSVATDSSGNTNSCTFLVVVVDQEAPHIACPAPIVRPADKNTCSATNVTYSLSVTDSVPVGVSYVCIPPSGSAFPVGTNTVNCTATDAAGNKASCAFTVTIEDKQIPTLTLPPDISQQTDAGSCSAVVSFNPTAFDLCSNPVILVCVPPSGSTFQKGSTVVTCRATDASGNSVTNTFHVTVNDTEAPHVVCPADIHVPSEPGKSSAIANFIITATDNCGTPTIVSTPASGSRFPMGTNVVTSTATDSSGNKSTCTFLVVVGDTQPPTITCPAANMTATNTPGLCSAVVTFVVTANDSKPGTTVACQPPSGSAFPTGTNLVTCTATDASGNTAQCVFLVIVRDTEKPILRLIGPGPVTNECHTAFVDPGATATDNCGGNLTSAIKVTGTVDANTPGIYQLTYSVTDASGNTVSLTRSVTVVDTRAPVLTLLAENPFFVPCGKTYEEPGFSATDACAGDLTSAVVVSGSVDASAPGTYTLTYTVTDSSGNSSVATRRVEVSTGIIEGGQLFPIAVGKTSLNGAAVGDIVANIYNGIQPGNFGWITWSGSASAGALATSLLPPGNSDTYQNPYNANDHTLSVGDWVMGNTGVSDSSDIRTSLDILKQFDITVPVYDLSTSSGSGALYHIVAFARVRLTAYDLSQKTISARFLGYVTCSCEGNDLMNMSLQSSFNLGNINAGSFLWFNGVLRVSGIKTNAVKIRIVNQTITGGGFNLSVSNASVIFDPAATNATVDFVNGEWLTRVPMTASNENVFLSGLAYQLPAGISGKTKAYWNGTFLSDTPDVTLSWKWAVAPYTTLPSDGRMLGVKPVDNGQMSIYKNADLAGTPENYKGSYIAGKAAGYTGAYSGVASVSACHNLNGQSMAVPKGVTVLPLIGGKHSVMWTAKPGKSYKVQYKDSLKSPAWTDLPGTVTATDAVASSIDNTVSPLTQRFYRIVMLP